MKNRMKEGGKSVYRIAVLAEQEAERQRYAEQITWIHLVEIDDIIATIKPSRLKDRIEPVTH